jgi:prepilin-type N-terminal cleavage/methylation domain-containing protein
MQKVGGYTTVIPPAQFRLGINAFTLIELVIVLVILGILGAVIIPKFYNIDAQSRVGVTNTVADALNAASALNYMYKKTGSPKGITVNNCTSVLNALPPSYPLPTGYAVTSAVIAADAEVTCTVTNPDTVTTATFIGKGVS